MDGGMRDLYQQIILDHNKNPKNYGALEAPSHEADGYNPLCGDKLSLDLDVEQGVIKDVRFEGAGCAISKASASVMTTILKGKSLAEAKEIFDKFQEMITAEPSEEIDAAALGKLAVFSGVREYPSRVKCASLAWHTAIAAMEKKDNESKVVSTE
mgnify:CR=1 FL=1